MKVKVKLNQKNINYIDKILIDSLVETADAIKSDLIQSQTMPYDTGELQNRSTFINNKKKNSGKVSIVSGTLYARRLYFHPEYNFKQDENPNASAMWFHPYIDGNKSSFARKSFAKLVRGKL